MSSLLRPLLAANRRNDYNDYMFATVTSGPYPGRRRRYVTAALSLLWLNLAMAPCAMAVDQNHDRNRDCPGCPPGHDGQHHGESAAHHGHAEADTLPPCFMAQPDCCELDSLHVDDRPQKLDRDDLDNATTALELGLDRAAVGSPPPRHATGPPHPAVGSLRLHVLHCVYRD